MPKLPRGMFRRGSGFYTRFHQGGRDRWISLGPDYAEAASRLRKLRSSDSATPVVRMTVSQAARRWLATRILTGRNEKGQKLAATRVQRYLEPFMGHLLVSKLTREHLREYRVWLEGECRAPATVRHVLGDLRNLLYWSEEAGLIEGAPIPRRWLPRLPEEPPDRLTDDEVEQLAGLPEPHGFVIRFGLGTGLRWSEMCRVQAMDVKGGVLLVGQTKSGKLRRVPLPPDLLREVRRHVGGLVPFSAKSPGSFANAVRRKSGVRQFHVHQLRHTFACRWIEKGGSLAALQELLGHASIVTTQRYARLSDDLVRREVERLALG